MDGYNMKIEGINLETAFFLILLMSSEKSNQWFLASELPLEEFDQSKIKDVVISLADRNFIEVKRLLPHYCKEDSEVGSYIIRVSTAFYERKIDPVSVVNIDDITYSNWCL